jgi:hypothetical protein
MRKDQRGLKAMNSYVKVIAFGAFVAAAATPAGQVLLDAPSAAVAAAFSASTGSTTSVAVYASTVFDTTIDREYRVWPPVPFKVIWPST